MKIQKINIKNFKGLLDVEKNINGKNVYLIGGNGTGKTSFIDAVWVGLTGKNLPPEPTTDGAKRGQIELDLGECIARTKFTKGRPVIFELEDKKTRKPIKSPRTWLKKRIGVVDFDINDFFNKKPQQKIEYFAKILEVDFSEFDADLEEAIESRKFDKRKLLELESKIQFYNEDDAEKKLIDVIDLANEINVEKNKHSEYHRIKQGVSDIEDQIQELEQKLTAGKKWLTDSKNAPLSSDQILDLEKSLQDASHQNELIKEAKDAKSVDNEIDKLKKQIDCTQSDIDQLRVSKTKKISSSIPVEGLTYDLMQEDFMYNGLPLNENQQNTADQLILGMKIGASLLKDLKIMKVDGSLIDKKNFDKVLAWAKEQDIELFVELVDRDSSTLQINVEE